MSTDREDPMPTVYVTETGVTDPEWVVNTIEDMRENYDSLLTVEPRYPGSFADYLASYTALTIPAGLDAEAEQAAVTAAMTCDPCRRGMGPHDTH